MRIFVNSLGNGLSEIFEGCLNWNGVSRPGLKPGIGGFAPSERPQPRP